LKGKIEKLFDLTKVKNLSALTEIIKNFPFPSSIEKEAKNLGFKPQQLTTTPVRLLKSIMADDWSYLPTQHEIPSISQIFAKLVRSAGFSGILYKSVREDGDCIALFVDKLTKSNSFLEIQGKAPLKSTITRLDQSNSKKVI